MEGMGAFSREWCRDCKGSGTMGSAGGYRIFCERCDGTGLDWTERCCLDQIEARWKITD